LIIGGDFNCILAEVDRVANNVDGSLNALKSVLEDLNVIDIWRFLNPDNTEFTYIDPSPRARNSRIDLILCSDAMKSKCTSSVICQAPAPDHQAVTVRYNLSVNSRGKGYWKLNNSLLKYDEYEKGKKDIYEDIMAKYNDFVPKAVLWDYFKLRVKQYSVQFGICLAQHNKNICKQLESSLDRVDRELIGCNSRNDVLIAKRKEIKHQLDAQYQLKNKGYQIRSRAKYVEEGEQSTSYFLNLEKSRQNYNCISSLTNSNGETVYKDDEILGVASSYYESLYKANSASESLLDEYFASTVPEKRLSEDLQTQCDGQVTLDECTKAVNKIKKNKSPGLDGITIEFYVKFWPLIGNLLVEVLNEGYDNNSLSDSQRLSLFSLLFKKGDTCDISNYRPISLTNVDYRILAYVLAERLQSVIDSIVSKDQNAYIRNRYMGDNIRLVQDVIEYFEASQKGGLLFMIDFTKAFDSIDWKFMFKALEFFNFGDSFKRWIHTLYHMPVGKVKNNGYISNEFQMSRGIRQGCPVSALLFILCIEILGLRIRQSKDLKGFDLGFPDKLIKTVQYADDCILALNDKSELCTALAILKRFGDVSNLYLNLSKCEGLWIGRDKFKQIGCSLFGVKWPQQVRCLGIFVGHSEHLNIIKNWRDKIDKTNSILHKWKTRNLSLFGKVQVIKSLAISQFVLPATLLLIPPDILKDIETLLYRFLWGGKDKVSRIKVVQSLNQGGLNMTDVRALFKSFKAAWIPKLLSADPNIHGWSQLPNIYFKHFIACKNNLIFNFDNTIEFHDLKYFPNFYRDIFECYNQAYVLDITDFKNNIYSMCIWANKFITVKKNKKKSVLFLRNWVRSGIRNIKDLRFIDGKLDVNYVIQKVRYSNNLWAEIYLVRNALLPYCDILRNFASYADSSSIQPNQKLCKSKSFYTLFKFNKSFHAQLVPNYLAKYIDNADISLVFTRKIELVKEIKLREFNFKIIHGILPCNLNLYRWKIRISNECDVCKESQSIEHLLYNCYYVKPLWDVIEKVFNIDVNFERILGIANDRKCDSLVTLISFLIYKDWLLLSLDDKCRGKLLNIDFFIQELSIRLDIYKLCNRISIKEIEEIQLLLDAL